MEGSLYYDFAKGVWIEMYVNDGILLRMGIADVFETCVAFNEDGTMKDSISNHLHEEERQQPPTKQEWIDGWMDKYSDSYIVRIVGTVS